MKLVGIFQQLSHFVLRRGKFVSEAQTVHSSCSQMFCSDIPVQSDVSVNSSCTGVFIWFRPHGKCEGSINSRPAALVRETALPFRLEAADVPVDATIGSAQSRVNSRRRRLAPTGEDVFRTPTGQRRWTTTVFTGRVSEGVQQEASMSQAALSLLHLDGKSGDEVESPLVAERPPEPKLDPSDRQAQIQWAVKCLRCSTWKSMRRPSSHRPSSIPTDGERFNDELFVDVCDLVYVRENRYGWLVAVDQHWIRWAYLQGSLEGAEERAELFPMRMLVKCVLSWYVCGTQVQTTAAYSLWQKVRVEQSSRKRRTKRVCNIEWRMSIVSYEVVHALNERTGGWESPSDTSVRPANGT